MKKITTMPLRRVLFLMLFLFIFSALSSQIRYSFKGEAQYNTFLFHVLNYDDGPGWKGYYLDEEQNGFHISAINGITFLNGRMFCGGGVGYMNFEGINGVSIFADYECMPLKKRFTPLANIKMGYCHIWNQYDGGKGTALADFELGIACRVAGNVNIYLKTGVLFMQQSAFFPITLGVRL